MAAELKAVLAACIAPDAAQREAALGWLQTAQGADLPGFMQALSSEMADSTQDPSIRSQAGIQLKNCLMSRDDAETKRRHEAWRAFPEPVRQHVKQAALATIGTEPVGKSTAAQVIAAIAEAELPHNMWGDLMGTLLGGIQQPTANESARCAALEAVGYICENVDPEVLTKEGDGILTAVVGSMRRDQPSMLVKKAAVEALTNSLSFVENNFKKDEDRNHIMQVICETTQAGDEDVQVCALQCLVQVMSQYYQYMESYMKAALFGITMQAMQSESENVALQGIEFWSTICEEEAELTDEMEDMQKRGQTPEAHQLCRFYAMGAKQHLLPIVLKLMENQDEHEDPDEWGVSKASHVCLNLLTLSVKDAVLEVVIPYVQQNLQNPEWQKRDAAVQAFGAVIDGPSKANLKPLVIEALPPMMGLMADPTPQVRDSLAWVLGRIIDVHPEFVVGDGSGPSFTVDITKCLLAGLQMEPRVVANVCWALGPLIEATYHATPQAQQGDTPNTFILSEVYGQLIQQLLITTERPDASQEHMRMTAYEALMQALQFVPLDCYNVLTEATKMILERLQSTVQQAALVASQGREAVMTVAEIQSSLCALIATIARCLKKDDAKLVAPQIMQMVLAIFESGTGTENAVQEDALMMLSALTDALDADFNQYVAHAKPYIQAGMKNVSHYEVCNCCVGLIGDIARSLGANFVPFGDDFMTSLLTTLQDPNVEQSVKPNILSCFSDVAMAIGPEFLKYFTHVMEALKAASVSAAENVQDQDYDVIDHMNELREGCLTAYTGCLAALKGEDKAPSQNVTHIMAHIPHIMGFVERIFQDGELSEENIKTGAGLVGDIIDVFGAQLLQATPAVLTEPLCRSVLDRAEKADDKEATRLARWLRKKLAGIGINLTPLQNPGFGYQG